jgi:hypothetical protein
MVAHMNALVSRITPGQVARCARIGALLIAFALTAGYVTDRLTLELAGVGALFLAMLTLLALPGQRSSELMGALAIWLTYAEFMAAIQSGQFNLWRWAVVLATLSLVIVPIKVQHLRQLARSNPYRPIGEQERRIWPAAASAMAPDISSGLSPDRTSGHYARPALPAIAFDPDASAGLRPAGT